MAKRPTIPGLSVPSLTGPQPIAPPQTFTAGAPQSADYNEAVQSFMGGLITTAEERAASRAKKLASAGTLASDDRVVGLVEEVGRLVKKGELPADKAVDTLYRKIHETTGQRLRNPAEQIRFQEDYGQNKGREFGQQLLERANDADLGFLLTPATISTEVEKFQAQLLADPLISAPGTSGSIARANALETFKEYVGNFRQVADQNLSRREDAYHRETVQQTLVRGNPEERAAGSRGFLDFVTANSPEERAQVGAAITSYINGDVAAIPQGERANQLASAVLQQMDALASEGRYADAETFATRSLDNTRLFDGGPLLGEIATGEAGATVSTIRARMREYPALQLKEDQTNRAILGQTLIDVGMVAASQAAQEGGDPRDAVKIAVQQAIAENSDMTHGLSELAISSLVVDATNQSIALATELQASDRKLALREIEGLAVAGDEQALINYMHPDPLVMERAKTAADGREARVTARDESSFYARTTSTIDEVSRLADALPAGAREAALALRSKLNTLDGQWLSAGPAIDPNTLTDDVVTNYSPLLSEAQALLTDLQGRATLARDKAGEVWQLLSVDKVAEARALYNKVAPSLGDPLSQSVLENVRAGERVMVETQDGIVQNALRAGRDFILASAKTDEQTGEFDPETQARLRAYDKLVGQESRKFMAELQAAGVPLSDIRSNEFSYGGTLAERILVEQMGESAKVPDKFPKAASQLATVARDIWIDNMDRDETLPAFSSKVNETVMGPRAEFELEAGVREALNDVRLILSEGYGGGFLDSHTAFNPAGRAISTSTAESLDALYITGASVGSYSLRELAMGTAEPEFTQGLEDFQRSARMQGVGLPSFSYSKGFIGRAKTPVQTPSMGLMKDLTLWPGNFNKTVRVRGRLDLPDGDVGTFFVVSPADLESGLDAAALYDRAVKDIDPAPLLKRMGAKDKREAVHKIEDALKRQKVISDL